MTMENAVIHGEHFDQVIIEWLDERSNEEVSASGYKWLANRHFLTTFMNGLNKVGNSNLAIKTVEETVTYPFRRA
ncbi:MAG: hypothetical protein AAB787_02850 [Patescibacteria group bacterium]